jgi:hypothetical protein
VLKQLFGGRRRARASAAVVAKGEARARVSVSGKRRYFTGRDVGQVWWRALQLGQPAKQLLAPISH